MVAAYETIVTKTFKEFIDPTSLVYPTNKHEELLKVRICSVTHTSPSIYICDYHPLYEYLLHLIVYMYRLVVTLALSLAGRNNQENYL